MDRPVYLCRHPRCTGSHQRPRSHSFPLKCSGIVFVLCHSRRLQEPHMRPYSRRHQRNAAPRCPFESHLQGQARPKSQAGSRAMDTAFPERWSQDGLLLWHGSLSDAQGAALGTAVSSPEKESMVFWMWLLCARSRIFIFGSFRRRFSTTPAMKDSRTDESP